ALRIGGGAKRRVGAAAEPIDIAPDRGKLSLDPLDAPLEERFVGRRPGEASRRAQVEARHAALEGFDSFLERRLIAARDRIVSRLLLCRDAERNRRKKDRRDRGNAALRAHSPASSELRTV